MFLGLKQVNQIVIKEKNKVLAMSPKTISKRPDELGIPFIHLIHAFTHGEWRVCPQNR